MNPRLLILDIETAPHTAYVWGLWDQNVGLSQLIETGRVMSVAAKWHGEKFTFQWDEYKDSASVMLDEVHKLLNEADAVVHYNGTKFDIPMLNKEFVKWGYSPPSGTKEIDLLKTVRSRFRFPSNKLDYVAQHLDLGSKENHEGFKLWIKCMEGDAKAWVKMRKYNVQDVLLTEKLYDVLTPWVKNGLNHGLFNEEMVCVKCGSDDLEKRGFAITNTGKYQRWQCNDCGGWSQEKKTVASSALKES
jgi:DNA polymerase III epsilon subunit-like protein